MGHIFIRGANYYGDYEHPLTKRRVQRSLRTSDPKVAKARLRELELHATDPGANSKETLGGALNYFTGIACAAKPASTRSSYEQKAAHLGRLMGAVPLALLGIEHSERYIATRLDEGAHRHSIHKELVVLRGALKSARQRKVWRGSMEDTVPKFAAKYEPKETYLTWEQFCAMGMKLVPALPLKATEAAILGSDALRAERAFFCILIVTTSARLGEVYKLDWSHVDKNRMVISLPKGKTKGRKVQIATELWPWLEAFGDQAGWTGPMVREWGNVRRDLASACLRAGVPRVTPNDLRRTFASWLKQNDVDSSVVAQLMGHSSTRMVDLVYGKLDAGTLARAIGRLPGGVTDGVTDSGANRWTGGTAGTTLAHAAITNSVEESAISTTSRVPRDGIEPPTRGFSVRCSTS